MSPSLSPSGRSRIRSAPSGRVNGGPLSKLVGMSAVLTSESFSSPRKRASDSVSALSGRFRRCCGDDKRRSRRLAYRKLGLLKNVMATGGACSRGLGGAFRIPIKRLGGVGCPKFRGPRVEVQDGVRVRRSVGRSSTIRFTVRNVRRLMLPRGCGKLNCEGLVSVCLGLVSFERG